MHHIRNLYNHYSHKIIRIWWNWFSLVIYLLCCESVCVISPPCYPSITLPQSDSDISNSHSSTLAFLSQTQPFLCSAVTISLPRACRNGMVYFSFSSSIHQECPNSGRHDSLTLNDHFHWLNSYNLTYEFVLIIGFLPLFICSPPCCFLLLLLR